MSKFTEELQKAMYGTPTTADLEAKIHLGACHPTSLYPFTVSILSNGDLVAGDCYRTRESAISNASDHIIDALRGKVDMPNMQVLVLALVNDDDGVEAIETVLSFVM